MKFLCARILKFIFTDTLWNGTRSHQD